MATTSPNFTLILATTSDAVSVTSHIANNFATVDSVLGIVHTGTGQLKTGVVLVNPAITGGTLTGTLSGGVISASTGNFNTITATGGNLTVNTFNIGNYNITGAIGNSGEVLTVVTGNAVFAAPAPGTGANGALSNLASVAINTNLNTFTAGFVTVARVIATSGSLTGLTVFQATTGTFAGNLSVTGTINANALNITGGSITAASLAIGTYALPATIGATGQVLTVMTGNAVWLNRSTDTQAYFRVFSLTTLSGFAAGTYTPVVFPSKDFDTISGYSTATGSFTVVASGFYQFGVGTYTIIGSSAGAMVFALFKNSSFEHIIDTTILSVATSGDTFSFRVFATNATNALAPVVLAAGTATSPIRFWGMKVPDA